MNTYFYFLDEVVKNKESHKQKLEAEDAQYLEKRKERARKIIQYEREELDRRETEVGISLVFYSKDSYPSSLRGHKTSS